MVLRSVPGNEVSHLSVVAIVSEVELWPYEQDLAIENNDTAVVSVVAVHDWHANIGDDAMDGLILKYYGELFPCMQVGITFEEVIQQAVASDFKSTNMLVLSLQRGDAYRTLVPVANQ